VLADGCPDTGCGHKVTCKLASGTAATVSSMSRPILPASLYAGMTTAIRIGKSLGNPARRPKGPYTPISSKLSIPRTTLYRGRQPPTILHAALPAPKAVRPALLRSLFFDEAQYWSWSRDLACGCFSKPPLITWVIRFATEVCGEAEWRVRAPSPILHTVTFILFFCRARALRRSHRLLVCGGIRHVAGGAPLLASDCGARALRYAETGARAACRSAVTQHK
jgi:dolichyl-phosphate-mannose-protein mannosyltransferase